MMRLALYLGQTHACNYLPGQMARSAFIDPNALLNDATYQQLMEKGFRRSGNLVYRPHCDGCQSCIPCRLPVARFTPNRSQKRCLARNQDIQPMLGIRSLTNEHFHLYQNYLAVRHQEGEMKDSSKQDAESFLLSDWCSTELIEFRLAGHLVGVAVTDLLPNALSAVYSFFDPALTERSLGTYAILQQLNLARKLGIPYLYLGFWVPGSDKMSYKARFQPLQRLDETGRWL